MRCMVLWGCLGAIPWLGGCEGLQSIRRSLKLSAGELASKDTRQGKTAGGTLFQLQRRVFSPPEGSARFWDQIAQG